MTIKYGYSYGMEFANGQTRYWYLDKDGNKRWCVGEELCEAKTPLDKLVELSEDLGLYDK